MNKRREKKIDFIFRGDSAANWRAALLFCTLRTEEEFTQCAISCFPDKREPFALRALARVTSKDALYRIATTAARMNTRAAAMDRFAQDRALLLKVLAYRNYASYLVTATHEQARKRLKALELQTIAADGDPAGLTERLCRGEITEAYAEALARISDETQLLSVLRSEANRDVIAAAIDRAGAVERSASFSDEIARRIAEMRLNGEETHALALIERDCALLLRVMKHAKLDRLRLDAENRLYAVCGEKNPLTEAQKDALLQFYLRQGSMYHCTALRLLGKERLTALFEAKRNSDYDLACIARALRPEDLTEAMKIRLFFVNDGQTKRFGDALVRTIETDRLKALLTEDRDRKLKYFVYSELTHRDTDLTESTAILDALILPEIEAAKTEDGYDGGKLIDLYDTLTPELRAQYGFAEENHGGETIDDAEWSAKQLLFGGHKYWVYYGQTDGGGSYHPRGERIY